MKLASSSPRGRFSLNFSIVVLPVLFVAAATSVTTGCGSSGNSGGGGPKLSGNTSVTIVLSSTANDQLSRFNLELQTLTLTGQSGKTATLLSTQQPSEFVHLNGSVEPLTTRSVPQDIYTAATATIGGADFTCITVLAPGSSSPGSLATSTYAYGYTPNSNVTVNLPSPITVTGQSMNLLLDLQVSQSASFPSACYTTGIATYSITPTFNLTAATFSSQPTNSGNGKSTGVEGQIASMATTGSSFSLAVPEGPPGTRTLSVRSGSATVYQGISSFSSLAAGMFVNMDGAIQADGSLLATRIAVEDPSAVNVLTGPLAQVSSAVPVLAIYGRQQQGLVFAGGGINGVYLGGVPYFDFSHAVFQISSQLANLQNLPFVPSFNASNMVGGQNVDLTSPAYTFTGGVYTPANTITLIPQVINGTIAASSNSGSFTVYSVTLAPYDLFPTLAVQPGQTTLLNNPSEVQVYVDSNTQLLNKQTLVPGSTLRFYGLVFNDNGTLRIDCAQVTDGIAFSTEAKASSHLEAGPSQSVLRDGPGGLRQTISVVRHFQKAQR